MAKIYLNLTISGLMPRHFDFFCQNCDYFFQNRYYVLTFHIMVYKDNSQYLIRKVSNCHGKIFVPFFVGFLGVANWHFGGWSWYFDNIFRIKSKHYFVLTSFIYQYINEVRTKYSVVKVIFLLFCHTIICSILATYR